MPADGDDSRTQWVKGAVARFEKALTLYAVRFVADLEEARDIVQETFLRLCRQRQSDLEPRLAEWLYTVCRNLAIDRCRKDHRMRPLETIEHQLCAEEKPDTGESLRSVDLIMRALSVLPRNQQEVIRLKFQHGMSYKDISTITKLTVSNVGFLLHTGLTTLRVTLAQKAAADHHFSAKGIA